MSGVSFISEDMRAQITRNYVAGEREARFASFHFMAFFLVGLIAVGALVVDYMIVSEFWTRALANEFLELPGALGSSVAFKSMQVLFATVAAHILYEQLGPFGKALFVRIVFVLALTMLLGVGVLLALMSLPNGIAATSDGSVGSSLGNALAGLGIATEATQETARTASEIDQMRGWQPMAWLASLGIVFLVVTGVAALCIHYAVSSLRRVFHARAGGMVHGTQRFNKQVMAIGEIMGQRPGRAPGCLGNPAHGGGGKTFTGDDLNAGADKFRPLFVDIDFFRHGRQWSINARWGSPPS